MNYADTEKFRYVLLSKGFAEVPKIDSADVIILNTCSVRQRAEDKVLGLARKVIRLKQVNPGLKVFLTGCMAERVRRNGVVPAPDPAYSRAIKTKMPWIDEIIGIGDVGKLSALLGESGKFAKNQTLQAYMSNVSAFVPISTGCDNFCTYCIVPFSRGKETSRSYEEIRDQMKSLISNNFKMITLLGQNVNSWKGIIEGKSADFADLLHELNTIDGDYWLSFLTSHPKDLSEKLIDVLAEGGHLCPYLNLPAQSGSNKILTLMNRKYTREQYCQKVELLRKKIPNIRLSTDIIVGFPGESTDDYEQTYQLLKSLRYGMAYVSEYSPRLYSVAAKLEDTVSDKEKSERKKQLEDLQRKIMEELNKNDLGKKVRILVTGEGRGLLSDLREVQFTVDKTDNKIAPGVYLNAVVTGVSASGLQVSFTV